MEDTRLGSALRAIRIRKGWRQSDLELRSGVRRHAIGRIEAGRVGPASVADLRRVAASLDAHLELVLRWRGAELSRLTDGAHAALHESVAGRLAALPDWELAPEVSFAVFGERGVIDLLAWHGPSRSLLVIELKTILVDPQRILAAMSTRTRLARVIVHGRGWQPATVSTWLILTDTRTNRRHVAAVGNMLRNAFPHDGRKMGAWLRHPAGRIDALSFWTDGRAVIHRRVVRRRATAPATVVGRVLSTPPRPAGCHPDE